MTLVLETLGAVAGAAAFYKLYKHLRGMMKPSDETMEKMKEAEKLVKNFTYKNFKENFQCEAFKGIPVDDFEEFVNKLKVRFKLDDTTKESLHEILSMDASQAHKSDIRFDGGKGEIHYHQIIAMKIDGKINLGITTFTFEYELDSMIQIRWLFGFIPIKQKVTCDNNNALTMTQEQKDKLEIWCQVKSFQHIDKKVQNYELED